MSNILDSYIPKFLVNVNKTNADVIFVSSSNFSEEGDVYELDVRTVSPNVIQTTQSINELQPEISTTYPYKIVTPIDIDGATLVLVGRDVKSIPTASQHYYAPIYFERYKPEFLNSINKSFNELPLVVQTEVIPLPIEQSTPVTTRVETSVTEATSPNVSSITTTVTQVITSGSDVPQTSSTTRKDILITATTFKETQTEESV